MYSSHGLDSLVLVANCKLFRKNDITIPTAVPDIDASKNHLKNTIDISSLSLICFFSSFKFFPPNLLSAKK